MPVSGTTRQPQDAADSQASTPEPPRPRPLLIPAIALIVGIWLSELSGPLADPPRAILLGLPLLALALLFLSVWRKPPRHVLMGLVAAVALPVGFTRHQSVIYRPLNHIVHALSNEPVLTRLVGTIVTAPITRPPVKLNPFLVFEPAPRTQFVFAVRELRTTDPPTPLSGHVRVSIEAGGLKLGLGQRVQLTGRVYRPRGPRNPGEMDWSRWYRQQGVDAGLVVEGAAHVVPLPQPPSWWFRLVNAARSTAHNLLFEPYADFDADPAARLLDTMVLGQRSAADQSINEAFLRAGGTHFLAVSGFNVSLLAGAGWWFVRHVLRRGRSAAAVAALLLTMLFALVTEPNAPILRATVAAVLAALAGLTRRPMCVINWLALAAAFVLLCNPLELFRAGFQLSFVLVTALVTIVPPVYRIPFGRPSDDALPHDAQTLGQLVRLKLGRALGGLFITCACAYVVSVPLVLFHFGLLAPWGWLGTLLLTPLVTFVTLLSLVTLLANALLPPLGALLGLTLRWSAEGLLWSVGLFEHLPGAVIDCHPPTVWLVLATYGAFVAWATRQPAGRAAASLNGDWPPRRKLVSARTVVTATALVLLSLGWIGWLVFPARARGAGYAFHVLDVGDGSAALLTTPTGSAALFDVGTNTNSDAGEIAARALHALRLRHLDLALISHTNVDHYSGLPTLLRSVGVARWLVSPYFLRRSAPDKPAERLLELLPPHAPPPAVLRAGDRFALGEALFEVLWPPDGLDETWAQNDRSLVVRLIAAGRTVLLTGDLEKGGLRALLDAEREGRISLQADVLIAPHHGSVLKDVTADFYAAVSPAVVVASTRTPRPKLERVVSDTLGPMGRVLMTGRLGDIVIRITPEGELLVETPYAHSR